jgi:transcriptional regulator with XRE-family HTH domain
MAQEGPDVAASIRDLRSKLGDSQKVFSNRLGISQGAIANYEAGRRPTSAVLNALCRLAANRGFDGLAAAFASAFSEAVRNRTEPTTPEERAWVRVVLALVRNRELVPEWPGLAGSLLTALEGLIATAVTTGSERIKTDLQELDQAFILARPFARPSAEDELEAKARERSQRTGESHAQAYSEVLLENPDLYTRYLQERADKAEGTSLEPSLAVYGTRQHREKRPEVYPTKVNRKPRTRKAKKTAGRPKGKK